jgi:L-amino acid N-acyltransferase YncA
MSRKDRPAPALSAAQAADKGVAQTPLSHEKAALSDEKALRFNEKGQHLPTLAIFERFGGRKAFRIAVEASVDQAHRWSRGGIPEEFWDSFLLLAEEKGIALSWTDFYEVGS